jgi:hypothetical protein
MTSDTSDPYRMLRRWYKLWVIIASAKLMDEYVCLWGGGREYIWTTARVSGYPSIFTNANM